MPDPTKHTERCANSVWPGSPQLSRRHRALSFEIVHVEAFAESGLNDAVAVRGGLNNRRRVGQRTRQRLLYKNMLARHQRADRRDSRCETDGVAITSAADAGSANTSSALP